MRHKKDANKESKASGFLSINSGDPIDCLNLLVVEDDPDISSLIQMAIHAWKLPLNVDFVGDGFTALRYIMKSCPDVMILDLRLPVLDGFSIIEALQEGGHRFPIIVVTGLNSEEIQAIGDLPENSYLMQKPIDLNRFRKLLQHFINAEITIEEKV